MIKALTLEQFKKKFPIKKKKFSPILNTLQLIRKYGTSAGAYAAWETMAGRRSKEEPKTRGHLEKPVFAERDKMIAEDIGLKESNPKVARTATAIDNFTGMFYSDIRRYQSNRAPVNSEHMPTTKEDANLIEEYIDKAPKYDEPIFRGIALSQEATNALSVGQTVDMQGTSSWTTNSKTARRFGRTIFVSSNVSRAVAISHLSNISSEREVIVSKDSKFKIVDIKDIFQEYPTVPGSKLKPYKVQLRVVRVREQIAKNTEISFTKRLGEDTNKVENSKIESDRHIKIFDEKGNLVYEYTGQTSKNLEMSPEIGEPTIFIGQRPKPKIRVHKKGKKKIIKIAIRKYGTSEGAYRAWETMAGRRAQSNVKVKPSGQIKLTQPKTPEEATAMMRDMNDKLEVARQNMEAGTPKASLVYQHVLGQHSRAMAMAQEVLNQAKGEERRGKPLAVATYETDKGNKVMIEADSTKFREYADKVQTMKDVADSLQAGDFGINRDVMQAELEKLDRERSTIHSNIVEDTVNRMIEKDPSLAHEKQKLSQHVRTKIGDWADKIISHIGERNKSYFKQFKPKMAGPKTQLTDQSASEQRVPTKLSEFLKREAE